jgi:hypothetical protein
MEGGPGYVERVQRKSPSNCASRRELRHMPAPHDEGDRTSKQLLAGGRHLSLTAEDYELNWIQESVALSLRQ